MNRRQFVLRTVGAGAALGIGWSLFPPRQRLSARSMRDVPQAHAMNGWVRIGEDDSISVVMARVEMGQGVHTTLAMLLCDELDGHWPNVRTEAATFDAIYGNVSAGVDGLPFTPDDHGLLQRSSAWLMAKLMREAGIQITGGSSSIKDLWLPMRTAGASARAMLIRAAAERWKVPVAECTASDGVVSHLSGTSLKFGALAAAASRLPLVRDAALKEPSQFRWIGKGMPRRAQEGEAKARGTATFGIDALPEGLRYASVIMCPTLGGTVARVNDAAAKGMAGVRAVVQVAGHNGGTGGVAVIADTPWQAMQAARAVEVTWDHGAAATFSSAGGMTALASALDDDAGFAYLRRGDVATALTSAARTISAEYRAPWLAHAAMEPINCTVQVRDGRATVWVSTQVPDLARHAVAKVTGLASDRIDMHAQLLGGGFGRRLEVDFIAQAAEIAMHADGKPVQVLWSREQDMRHDFYRPACVTRLIAGIDATGAVTAWRSHSASQSVLAGLLQRVAGVPVMALDKTTAEGAYDQPYEFAAARVAHTVVELPVPAGSWRSVGHSHQAFFTECFLDELAALAGADPVAYRLALLRNHPRHARVLQRAAELAQWGTPAPAAPAGARAGRGVALHESFGAVVAQVADVRVDADSSLHVTRITCVVDCGFPVNPNTIRQQMESGVLFGLSAALHGEITIERGQVQQGNFDTFGAVRLRDCPRIEVDIIPSTAHPEGVGEPAVPPVAPAVANAVFAATGQRLRSLPLRLS